MAATNDRASSIYSTGEYSSDDRSEYDSDDRSEYSSDDQIANMNECFGSDSDAQAEHDAIVQQAIEARTRARDDRIWLNRERKRLHVAFHREEPGSEARRLAAKKWVRFLRDYDPRSMDQRQADVIEDYQRQWGRNERRAQRLHERKMHRPLDAPSPLAWLYHLDNEGSWHFDQQSCSDLPFSPFLSHAA